jgi:hypothetical protein
MATELLPLKPNQHTVTFVPRVTTDLPFFNLTYNKRNTPTEIKFEGKDDAGNPMRWEVYHNTSERIGYAGVLAHEVWYLLIKPAIDASRTPDGSIPQIIQLGGIRECLRMIGWTAGGHEANELIKVLSQIAFAGVVADLWFPTGEFDSEGKQKFLQVKGRFSRLSVYAIGEHHLTQEELEDAQFEFDLEDKLYIQLNSLEARLQQLQAQQQKLIDNEYMFSVKPIARRWYELLAGKVYGTIKHNAPFFEIKYSWYIKHHHTLKRFYEMKRVKEQMNRAVEDHINTGFLIKAEYRKFKEADQELDFTIRYYVGQGAKDSISRIKGYLSNKERKKGDAPPKVKKAHIMPKSVEEMPNRSDIPTGEEKGEGTAFLKPESIAENREEIALLDTVTEAHRETIKTLFIDYQIAFKTAYKLTTEKFEECRKQINAMPFREVELKSKTGFLIKAIENSYSLPESYTFHLNKKRIEKEQAEQKEKDLIWQKERESLITACRLCNENGNRSIKHPEDARYQMTKPCTHDEAIEAKFENWK